MLVDSQRYGDTSAQCITKNGHHIDLHYDPRVVARLGAPQTKVGRLAAGFGKQAIDVERLVRELVGLPGGALIV